MAHGERNVRPFEGDLADYSRFVLGQADEPQQKRKREYHAPLPAPRREPQLKLKIAALEDRMSRFHDLLRRVDEALAQASTRGGDALKVADLAAKRAELERALTAAEEAWFDLTAEAEEA